ncbi:MAG: hypothetical protein WCR70_09765, partial [Sphaerochaetaceae bacterium]
MIVQDLHLHHLGTHSIFLPDFFEQGPRLVVLPSRYKGFTFLTAYFQVLLLLALTEVKRQLHDALLLRQVNVVALHGFIQLAQHQLK